MSLIPLNPPCIVQDYSCADTTPSGSGGREGEKIWEGRCAGFMVHSWPHVEQTLEIIDKERQESMQIIPVPGKPIHFGTIRTVELRTTFHVGLLVSWRTVLEAFIDPIYAMVGMSSHGNAQWKPMERNRSVNAGATTYGDYFYAWADGILRYVAVMPVGAWDIYIHSACQGGDHYRIVSNISIVTMHEVDLPMVRVTAGRYYRYMLEHDDLNPQVISFDLGIIKDPIDQT